MSSIFIRSVALAVHTCRVEPATPREVSPPATSSSPAAPWWVRRNQGWPEDSSAADHGREAASPDHGRARRIMGSGDSWTGGGGAESRWAAATATQATLDVESTWGDLQNLELGWDEWGDLSAKIIHLCL